jgi:hypothetical protein
MPLIAAKAKKTGKAVSGTSAAAGEKQQRTGASEEKQQGTGASADWSPLLHRLRNDPAAAGLDRWFRELPAYSPQPMGTKIKELFTAAFTRKRAPDGKPREPRPRIYRNVVTAENLAKCRDFLNAHAAVFDAVEKNTLFPATSWYPCSSWKRAWVNS